MTKYKEYYQRMIEENKDTFDTFTTLHFEYSANEDELQEKFNTEGIKILEIVREWENRLCKASEGAGFGSYTTKLAEKFQEEVRSHFPLIDHIGIIVKRSVKKENTSKNTDFKLKKITLN